MRTIRSQRIYIVELSELFLIALFQPCLHPHSSKNRLTTHRLSLYTFSANHICNSNPEETILGAGMQQSPGLQGRALLSTLLLILDDLAAKIRVIRAFYTPVRKSAYRLLLGYNSSIFTMNVNQGAN